MKCEFCKQQDGMYRLEISNVPTEVGDDESRIRLTVDEALRVVLAMAPAIRECLESEGVDTSTMTDEAVIECLREHFVQEDC